MMVARHARLCVFLFVQTNRAKTLRFVLDTLFLRPPVMGGTVLDN